MKTLHAFYDISVNPLTFDIQHFLLAATTATIKNGFDGFHLHVLQGPPRMQTPKDKQMSPAERQLRIRTIIQPIANLCKYCTGFTYYADRAALEDTGLKGGLFPVGYTPKTPKTVVLLSQIFEQFGSEYADEVFTPEYAYQELVNQKYPYDYITITVRNSKIDTSKNPTIDWYAVAERLERDGHNVVILPDVHDAYTVPLYESPIVDLGYRFALQCGAKLNLGEGGGPNFLPFFSEYHNSLIFMQDVPDELTKDNIAAKYFLMGVTPENKQWPQNNEKRRFEWFKPNELTTEQVADKIHEILG